MDDITKYSRDRKVRLEIWETNKGPALGYVYWRVQRLEDNQFWVTNREAGRYMTIDEAYITGVRAFREVKRMVRERNL